MALYTIQQRIQIVELFYENLCSVKSVFRKSRELYGLHNHLSESTTGQIIKNFKRPVRWKIKKLKNTVVAVIHKKILIWFVKVLSKTLKCQLDNIRNKLAYFTQGFSSEGI